ncbi:hypothetical protein SETIT_3G231600v2 [Setaria italica]|uniref:Uncharacterized protein n=1 Tax=Setaria italica TaxID=4555 RepID=A0A368QI64_SETIT|nr:hypothetical protein SETIT_3G231600v2 [Setaria italica]
MACSGDGGWGYVIRDDACTVVSAGAGRCEYLLDALHAELLACLEGQSGDSGEKGISKVVIETNSILVKLAVVSNTFSLAATGGIIFEIKNVISTFFTSWSIWRMHWLRWDLRVSSDHRACKL